MSNHNGSYMLNGLLVMLERESYFAGIGPEKTAEFVTKVVGLARDYDGSGRSPRRDRRTARHLLSMPAAQRPARRRRVPFMHVTVTRHQYLSERDQA